MTGQDLYRIRDFVPDFDAIATEIASRSHALAARSTVQRDLAYGTGPREVMDIILPPDPRPGAPLHMFVHGGYWRSGAKADYTCVAAPVLAAGGIAAIVEYDLMPAIRLGVIVWQIRRAAQWLAEHAASLGADPARLTVSGHSAGAHLASFLAATGKDDLWAKNCIPLKSLLLVSGIYDLSGIPESFLKTEAQMRQDEAEAWSPLSSHHHSGPTRIIALGDDETPPFHDQADKLHAMLQAQGGKSSLLKIAGLNHMNVVLDLSDPSQPLGAKLAEMVSAS